MPGYPVTNVETVTIIKIKFQGSEDEATIKNAINFLKRHDFTSNSVITKGPDKSTLRTTFSKYYPSQYIDAEEYELLRAISKDGWHSVKQSFISLVQHAYNNTENMVTGEPWSMELLSPDPDAGEYTPVKLPMLGFAFRLSYTRDCDEIPEECGLDIED